jgi:hypothetical protein
MENIFQNIAEAMSLLSYHLEVLKQETLSLRESTSLYSREAIAHSTPEYLTKEETKIFLGKISTPSLDKLVRIGALTPCRPTPNRVVFAKEDLQAYLLKTKTVK